MSKKTVFRIKLDKVQLPDNHDLYIDIEGRATKIELLKESVLGPSEHAYFYNFDILDLFYKELRQKKGTKNDWIEYYIPIEEACPETIQDRYLDFIINSIDLSMIVGEED